MAKSTSNLFSEDEKKDEVVKTTTKKETVAKKDNFDDVQDIDLSAIKKKRFRIDGDNNKIIELNTSDLNIVARLGEAYPRLNTLMDKVQEKLTDIPDDTESVSEEDFKKISDILKELDENMRKEIDYIFNEPVSEVCGADGNMWDPIDGAFRYEHIIDRLSKLYETNLNEEFGRMKAKLKQKTQRYTKGTKKR